MDVMGSMDFMDRVDLMDRMGVLSMTGMRTRQILKVGVCAGAVVLFAGVAVGQSGRTAGYAASTAGYAAQATYGYAQRGADIIDPGHFDEARLCGLIFDLTNAERARAGLRPLAQSRGAASAATQHSRDMASRGYFDHKSKGFFKRTNPSDRMATYGYQPRMSAENIAMIPTFNNQIIRTSSDRSRQVMAADYNSYDRLARYAMREWMNSPGHRKNIMNPQLSTLGVGVAVGMRKNVPYVYLTQDFGG